MTKKLLFLTLLSIYFLPCYGQLNGSYTVPGSYATLAAAISALNTSGVSSAVTINVAAGYTETAPAGGYILGSTVLNASLSATTPLTITKSGTGSNPVITAPTGTSSTVDGIFFLAGTDYVTINGINLQENVSNTTAVMAMETGYALVNLSNTAPIDGCNYNTIQNCTITLNRSIATVSKAIAALHAISTVNTILPPASTADLHSNNKFYANTISNCITAFYLLGYDAAAPYTLYDQNNDIGGNTAATGNVLTNVIGNTYTGVGGITALNQNNANISYNSISQLTNGGVSGAGGIWGINITGTNSTCNITNNKISISEAALSTSYYAYGIYASSTGTSITISNNTVTTSDLSGSAVPNFAINAPNAAMLTISGNKITQTMGVSGSAYGILTSSTGVVVITSDTVTQTTSTAVNSQFYSIVSAGNTSSETIQNNVFANSSVASSGTNGYMSFIYTSNASTNKNISNNITLGTITHTSTSTASTFGILCAPGTSATGPAIFSNNNFSNIISSGIPFYGIYYVPSVASAQNFTISNNVISNIFGTNSFIAPVFVSSGTTGIISGNIISNCTTASAGDVYGIYQAGVNNVSCNIYKNKIYELTSGGGFAGGIVLAGGLANTVYNNLIGNLQSPVANNSTSDAVSGISITSTTANSSNKIYYNTIYLNASSTGNAFSTSGLFHTASTTATTATLDLRNNIIINNSTPGTTGTVAAIRRSSSSLSNFATTSNNNLLYSGAASATHIIYGDDATNYQTITDYKATVTPAETASISGNPTFASTTGSNANYLHFTTGTPSLAESRGVNITGFTDDFDGNIRQGNTGYAGTGTAPDLGAAEGEYQIAYPLAIKLLSFTGRAEKKGNNLTWKTASEGNADNFELQKSADGQNYTTLSIIKSQGQSTTYNFADGQPFDGNNYYRLKLKTEADEVSYSNTVLLNNNNANNEVSISPNPAISTLSITLPTGTDFAHIRLTDISGKLIREFDINNAQYSLSINDLATGMYILQYVINEHAYSTMFRKQ